MSLPLLLALFACVAADDADDARDTDAPAAGVDTDTSSALDDTSPSEDTGEPGETGETASPEPSIDADGDGFYADAPAETDCDDGDASVYPGAAELCDGVQNDCDDVAWVSDAGLATFFPSGDRGGDLEEPEDWSVDLAGVDGDPGAVSMTRDGTLALCEGTWYASLSAEADVSIIGVGGDVALSGGDAVTPLKVLTPWIGVAVEGLTLTGGSADEVISLGSSEYVAGGGVVCGEAAFLSLIDVQVVGNTSGALAGGIYSGGGCSLYVEGGAISENVGNYGGGVLTYGVSSVFAGVTIADNYAEGDGGGLDVYGGDVQVSDALIRGNYSGDDSGGVNLGGASGTFTDVAFETNEALDVGGGVFVSFNSSGAFERVTFDGNLAKNGGGLLVLVGSSATLTDASFTDNTAAVEGGGLMFGTVDLVCEDCDFAGNSPEDLRDGGHGISYDLDEGESFSCNPSTCEGLD